MTISVAHAPQTTPPAHARPEIVDRSGRSAARTGADSGSPERRGVNNDEADVRTVAKTPTVKLKKIKFKNDSHPDFYRTVRERVYRYFEASGKSKYADGTMAAKAALYTLLVLSSYALVLSNPFGTWWLLVFANVFGLSSLLLAINVSHDAAHNSLTPNRRLNKLIHTVIFTLLGANAYLWQMRHVNSHHTFPNVNGCDIDIDHNALLRLSPNQPKRRFHKYQHLYAPLVFWLVDVHAVFYEDFVYLFKKRLANMVAIKHPVREYVIFVLSKLTYVAIVMVVPIMVIDLPWWQILLGYMIVSFVMSVVFVTLLIGTHFAEETVFPEVDADGRIANNWAVHALVTSLDWNPTSKLAHFIVGGANAHAAHHLFPTVCHTHYVEITKIIKQTAAEFGVKYNETTLLRMIKSHFRFLKKLGQCDDVRKHEIIGDPQPLPFRS